MKYNSVAIAFTLLATASARPVPDDGGFFGLGMQQPAMNAQPGHKGFHQINQPQFRAASQPAEFEEDPDFDPLDADVPEKQQVREQGAVGAEGEFDDEDFQDMTGEEVGQSEEGAEEEAWTDAAETTSGSRPPILDAEDEEVTAKKDSEMEEDAVAAAEEGESADPLEAESRPPIDEATDEVKDVEPEPVPEPDAKNSTLPDPDADTVVQKAEEPKTLPEALAELRALKSEQSKKVNAATLNAASLTVPYIVTFLRASGFTTAADALEKISPDQLKSLAQTAGSVTGSDVLPAQSSLAASSEDTTVPATEGTAAEKESKEKTLTDMFMDKAAEWLKGQLSKPSEPPAPVQ